jgi:hypothetical protein
MPQLERTASAERCAEAAEAAQRSAAVVVATAAEQ